MASPYFTADALAAAADRVHAEMPPTPQFAWPLLQAEVGAEVWVKHENHTPTGAFKIRGGITFIDWLKREHPGVHGIVTATRGNHGQSQARAAKAAGLAARIYVPHGNSAEKNAAMHAFGAELVEVGRDFDEARGAAEAAARDEGLFAVPSFHRELVRGVATYGWELFHAVADLHTVYVPVGMGSGLCGLIAARDALGLKTEVVGVVATGAPANKLSLEAGRVIETSRADTFADGIATRVPSPEALAIYGPGAARIVAVDDDEIAEAMRMLWRTTHNLAEGAGAAALAGLMRERATMRGRRVAVILT
ncbi:MAG: threonine dehydratase, partial [Rhodobacteraceae bacterium]|nr:threonine dehydratase [Paracoccaceae bacterium]